MACNCNNADPNCEPCAFCTPPGVKCLPDCDPEDPCPEKIDLCCVLHSGEDQPCSDITHGEPLCELLLDILQVEFPPEVCCGLELSIDLILIPPATTTTTTTSTSTTTSTTSTTTSSTTTTTTTTSTTRNPGVGIQLCYTQLQINIDTICGCSILVS